MVANGTFRKNPSAALFPDADSWARFKAEMGLAVEEAGQPVRRVEERKAVRVGAFTTQFNAALVERACDNADLHGERGPASGHERPFLLLGPYSGGPELPKYCFTGEIS